MNGDDVVARTIHRVGLSLDEDRGQQLLDRLRSATAGLDTAEKNAALLLLEQLILPEQGGHKVTIKLGLADAANSPPCFICRRPVRFDSTSEDVSLRIISRWENQQIWLTWHSYCISGPEVEMDLDLLTGSPTSQLGLS
jgi:hypothetical protein